MAKIASIPKENLFIDDRYQRDIRQSLITSIRKDFNPDKLGVLEVSQRGPDSYAVFDGQHRLLIASERDDVSKLDCKVHQNLTPEDEAKLFLEFQLDRATPSPYDKYKSRVFYGDLKARSIQAILASFNKQLGNKPGTGIIRAVTSIYAAYGRATLMETIDIIEKAWGEEEPASYDGAIIDGISRFIMYYADADLELVTKKLSEITPKVLIRRAHGLMEVSSFVRGDALVQEIRNLYNTGLPAPKKLRAPDRTRSSPKFRKEKNLAS